MKSSLNIVLLAALGPFAATGAGAQPVATNIQVDGSLPGTVVEPLAAEPGTTPGVNGQFRIDEGQGHRPGGGPNRFHSFSDFDVGENDTAVFTSPLPTQNIVSRVTGGSASWIHGTVESDIPGVNFYFLNPSGILFGPEGSINVDGSVNLSTAESLEFSMGERFEAELGGLVPTLAIAEPSEFGFLGDPLAPITFSGTELSNGADIVLEAGVVSLYDEAVVSTQTDDADPAGSIGIEAANVLVEGGSSITASTTAGGDGGSVSIVASEGVVVTGFAAAGFASSIRSDTSASGNAGAVGVQAAVVEVRDGAVVSTQVRRTAATGMGGDLTIQGSERVTVSGTDPQGPARLISGTAGIGDAGSTTVEAPVVEVTDGGEIVTGATAQGIGAGGRLLIDAGTVLLANQGAAIARSQSLSSAGSAGDIDVQATERIRVTAASTIDGGTSVGEAGNVSMTAPVIEIFDGSKVSTTTFGEADGGAISMVASREIAIVNSIVESTASAGTGGGGSVTLQAPAVRLAEGALIQTRTFSEGDGGSVVVSAGGVFSLSGSSSIVASASSTGNAGGILLDAATVGMSGGSSIASSATGEGNAGSISFGPGTRRVVLSASVIETTAAQGGLDADGNPEGSIEIQVSESLLLEEGSSISASVLDGQGGDITIGSPGSVVLNQGSEILAETDQGTGGRIRITTDLFIASQGSVVSADAGEGIDGTVEIRSPGTAIESGVQALETPFLDAVALLKPPCAVQADGGSSFVVARRPGLPMSPEDFLLAVEEMSPGGGAGPSPEPLVPTEPTGATQVAVRGADAFRRGDFEKAEAWWARAADLGAARGDPRARSDATRALAHSRQALGHHSESAQAAGAALSSAQESGDPARIAAAYGALSNAYLALGATELAGEYLGLGLGVARKAGETRLTARLTNNLGNQRVVEGAFEEAIRLHEESANLSHQAGDGMQEVRALASAARAALELDDFERARRLLARAGPRAESIPPSHEKAMVLVHVAMTHSRLARRFPGQGRTSLVPAYAAFASARDLARELGDPRSVSYAVGNMGALYQQENRLQEALFLTREALRAAEAASAADFIYRWHWQEGQLLAALGRTEESIRAHRRAVAILEETRQETRSRYGAADVFFRRAVAPVYLDLVDTLLKAESRILEDRTASNDLLREARGVMEQFKAAELRDYFRNECVADLQAKTISPELASEKAAVVYPVLLPDRLELLVSLPSGLERHRVAIGSAALVREAAAFRNELQGVTTAYLQRAQRLYDWLVRPYEANLVSQGVETLVFVPDGPLRTIPMAALHDGKKHLIERFGVATTPGLTLVEPRPLDRANVSVLLAGVSEAVQGYPSLPSVPVELESVRDAFGGELLLNSDFRTSRAEEEIRGGEPSIVHIASHGEFTGDPETSFLLTYDGRITMEQLSEFVGATKFREHPLELLVLSACKTAAGDEQAALGLAGLAIRAGARSALGSLWAINDEATAELIGEFYGNLKNPSVTKAEALRRAQMEMLRSSRFSHPRFWSPYLLISNWL